VPFFDKFSLTNKKGINKRKGTHTFNYTQIRVFLKKMFALNYVDFCDMREISSYTIYYNILT